MLPAELPDELENVAVDADRGGDEYGILFLFEPPGDVEQSYVHANDSGTIVAAPEPPYEPSGVFEATKEEQVELPDGTEATLEYMEPKEGELVNQGPYWEGSFEREGHHYVLRVPLQDPSGDMARQVLTSMVEVPGEGASGDGGEPPEEGAEKNGPAPGYDLISSPDGSLTVEAPQGWGVQTGADSEGEGANWSSYAEESLVSSITTASSIDGWYVGEASGAYLAASKSLARYSDYELTHSLLHENKAENCDAGPDVDLDRPGYSGKIQTWYGCGGVDATTFSVAAAPEGRECVVMLAARINGEADREAVEHLVGTFEVDCGRVTSQQLDSPSASASASVSAATPEPSQEEMICDEYGCMTPEEVAQQKALAESGTEAWWPGSGIERPQPNSCSATKTKADGC